MESDPDLVFTCLFSFSILLQVTLSSGVIFAIFMVMLLLICSALMSSSEVAFFSLTPSDVKLLEEEGTNTAQRILDLREMPRKLLATILISNNFINIAIVILSEFILRKLISDVLLQHWAERTLSFIPWLSINVLALSNVINISITVVGVTFLLVLFGEVAPKIYAKLNNLKLAKMMVGVLGVLINFLSPVSQFLVKGTNLIERRLQQRNSNGNITSKAEIDRAIELTVKHENHSKQDIDILKGIVKFGDVSVKQIMCSRMDVVAIDFRTSFSRLLKIVKHAGYSRVPIYDGDFDSVTGILYVKDLLGFLEQDDTFEWQTLIRTNVYYVPESKKINDLLREFQEQRLHMAIVVDEYGGSSGIVTLEDIMEEIIGEIRDEFDDDVEMEYVRLDEYNYVFEGRTLLNDVCRVIGEDTNVFDEARGDADSVAGLILELVGHFPKSDSEIPYKDFLFRIVSVNKRRIEKIQITLPVKKL